MPSLQIPYAFTNNKIPLSPEVAKKGQHFLCPTCDDEVILRRGDIRVPHFAHKPDTGCSGEGILHKTAKQMIRLMCNSVFGRVFVISKCPNCRRAQTRVLSREKNICAETEVPVGAHRLDVACFKNEKLHVGFEVRHTHPVHDEKWEAFREMHIPVIEVNAEDVIREWKDELIRIQLHAEEEMRKHMPKLKIRLTTPSQLYLKPIRNNVHLFNDRLPRIHCPDCDKKDLQPSGLEPEGLQAPDAVH